MKASRRRFFGLTTAVAVSAQVKATTCAPVVEMVEADIASVAMSFPRLLTTPTLLSEDIVLTMEEYTRDYVRPAMLRLAFEIDTSVYEAMGRPDLIGKA